MSEHHTNIMISTGTFSENRAWLTIMMASELYRPLSLGFQTLPVHVLSLKLGRTFFTKSFLTFQSPCTHCNPYPSELLDTDLLIHSTNTVEHLSCIRFWKLKLESIVDSVIALLSPSTHSACASAWRSFSPSFCMSSHSHYLYCLDRSYFLFFFSWIITALQCCVGFCCTRK